MQACNVFGRSRGFFDRKWYRWYVADDGTLIRLLNSDANSNRTLAASWVGENVRYQIAD